MKFLLDVNVLVAWGWADHSEHDRVARWIGRMARKAGTELLTSAIPQLGFVRVSVQRMGGVVSPREASAVLSGMIAVLAQTHRFIGDDEYALDWPDWCSAASQTTDAHLLALAKRHGAELATLDRGIPDSYLIP